MTTRRTRTDIVPPRLPHSIHPFRPWNATVRMVGDGPITNGRRSNPPCTVTLIPGPRRSRAWLAQGRQPCSVAG